MGANGSTELYEFGGGGPRSRGLYSHPQGKPGCPEGIPKMTDVTHNSVTLKWLSPLNAGRILAYQVECCNLKDRKWKVVTSTCQGSCYHVRNLIPETRYIFRIRAENICGQSKPGHVSDVVKTRPVVTNYLEEKPQAKLVRRHSHYLKIDDGLDKLLNRTESESTDFGSGVGSIPFRRNSLRGSLPATFRAKRNSVTSMLPGTQRENVCNLKDSKKSFDECSITEEEGLNLKRISTSSTEESSLFSSTSMTSIPEDVECTIASIHADYTMCSDTDDSYSTTNSHNSHCSSAISSASSECSSSSLSSRSSTSRHINNTNSNANYLTASITDDTNFYSNQDKNTLNRNKPTNTYTKTNLGKVIFDVCDNEIWQGRIDDTDGQSNHRNSNHSYKNTGTIDLRSIRQMLTSQDVMVQTLDRGDNSRRTHYAIDEADEDYIAMDIVSTI